MTIMLNGKINRGKTVILDYLKSSLNLPRARNKFNCLWALNLPSFCLHIPMCTNIQLLNSAIQHIVKSHLLIGIMEPMVYFQRVMALHLLINYCSSFHRKVVSSRGYCGAEFAGILPKEAPQAIKVVSSEFYFHKPITVYIELYLFYHFIHFLLYIGQC